MKHVRVRRPLLAVAGGPVTEAATGEASLGVVPLETVVVGAIKP